MSFLSLNFAVASTLSQRRRRKRSIPAWFVQTTSTQCESERTVLSIWCGCHCPPILSGPTSPLASSRLIHLCWSCCCLSGPSSFVPPTFASFLLLFLPSPSSLLVLSLSLNTGLFSSGLIFVLFFFFSSWDILAGIVIYSTFFFFPLSFVFCTREREPPYITNALLTPAFGSAAIFRSQQPPQV